ncbi:MAG: hypothetical protein WC197_08220 [Candidatus Gastranaerophilaceae bacterium]|jgi:hypothetical protein
MGAIAVSHLNVLAQENALNNLQTKLQVIMDRRQYLAAQTGRLANEKAGLFQQVGENGRGDEARLGNVQARESNLNQIDKMLDIQEKQVSMQIQIAEKRVEQAEKMRDKGIEKGFKGPGGN